MVRLHLLDTTGGDAPPQSWRYANLDRALMTSLLSAFALIIFLYMLYQCVCQPTAQLPDRSRLCRDHHPIDARIERLKSIPVVCYGDSSPPSSRVGDKTCPVCLAEFVQGEEVRVLPNCGHLFHRECVDRWLLRGSWLCPICREPPAIARDGSGIAIAVAEHSRRPRSSC